MRDHAAASWLLWEDTVLSLEPGAEPPVRCDRPDAAALAFTRLTAHYYSHAAWLEDGAVIRDAGHRGSAVKRAWMIETLDRFARR